jgi:hypothetical protein
MPAPIDDQALSFLFVENESNSFFHAIRSCDVVLSLRYLASICALLGVQR